MDTIQKLAEWNTNELHERICQKRGTAKHILDADCRHEEGVFELFSLPCKLPRLFTARFTAPADFATGEIFTLKGREFAVRTRTMEEPEGKLFSAGAVVQCDIDMERDLAFFVTGGDAGDAGQNTQTPCCIFQTGDLSFYIDPNGDDSLTNPGTVDSPFRTLAGARNAVSQRYIFTSMGNLIYNINPGTYELDADNRNAICNATHPQRIIFQASDPSNKPLLVADQFRSYPGYRTYASLRFAANNSVVVTSQQGSNLSLQDVEVIARAANMLLIHTSSGGTMDIRGSLTLDGGGYAAQAAFNGYGGCLNSAGIIVKIQNLPSVRWFVFCGGNGYFNMPRMTFTGSTTGQRYCACQGAVIDTDSAGANYFPGTTAGTLQDYASYTN